MDPRASRGFLNNNPGNMDRAKGEPWQGEIRDPNDPRLTDFQRRELTQGRFSVFLDATWGYRAMVKNLRAYRDHFGDRTVSQFISRWAPPNENNTGGYIASVAQRLGVGADAPVDLERYDVAAALADAITRVECAGMPYSGREIEDGLRLAGIVKPVTVGSSSTAKAATAATTGVVVNQAVTQAQGQLTDVVTTLAPVAATSSTLAGIFVALKILGVVLTLGGVGWMLYERFGRQKRDERIEAAGVQHDAGEPSAPVPT